ncbi:uncharacterized protein JN550_005822 [Neoarthrinium moseri]|uniref:uncharacterized protein n=1 Tax=Neoarthrinium moseri TaxID=1658444 RepID=UPI001FDBBCE2|nr:uncharacterized protein JN550_005822 [Neoarthrinium moseri]KAI1869192.1 hypothetical protein JN550_005822 [Neoarthrinium moseri]
MVSAMLLTAGLAAGALAAPATNVPGHRKAGFTVPQVRAVGHVRHGPTQMAKTLLKFGKTVPDELTATIKAWKISRREEMMKRSQGSAITTPEQYDTEYLTPVQIGTPAQTLNLDFDSGSSDLWVFSSETERSDVAGQATYNPDSSSTSKELSGASWDISYGDGSSSSGNVFTDVVSVGGVSFDSQAVETAKNVSTSFTSDANNDGLLGLAFSTLNTVTPTAQKTFFDNIKGSLDSSLWTVDLKSDKPGTYNFGFIDDTLHTGDIAYTDVDSSQGFWMFTADSYSVGSSSSGNSTTGTGSSTGSGSSRASASASSAAPSATSGSGAGPGGFGPGSGSSSGNTGSGRGGQQSGGSGSGSGADSDSSSDSLLDLLTGLFGRSPEPKSRASGSSSAAATTLTGIADTGTTLALLPQSVCEEYYAQVSGASYSSSIGGYVFSCDATTPSFSYTVGDVTIAIPGDYINYSPVDSSGSKCYGGIQPDSDIGFSIFGDVALKAAFVVFKDDGNTPQIGFAAKTL